MILIMSFDLSQYGISVQKIYRNVAVPILYEHSILYEKTSIISDTGALVVFSGKKTGRNPKDKRIVKHKDSEKQVWWNDNGNIPMEESLFTVNRQRAVDYFNTCNRLYVVDAFAGWDPEYRKKVRVICSRPYHALFMHNMLIPANAEELEKFEPEYLIFNAGKLSGELVLQGFSTKTTVHLFLEKKELVILGTEYAGEMKKGIFSMMHYIMPELNVLSMHCSANEGPQGDVSLLFGLSGTGKTTLSADPKRKLIGDDEHCWSDKNVFNIEGGCYAKVINLSPEKEPQIFKTIRFGTILENVIYSKENRSIDYDNDSITQNTRASYPIHFIPETKIPCTGQHPKNIIFLTCDAFGILPPVSKLTISQVAYHFISGYTAKIAGTEMGINHPEATFSPCFGSAFLVRHPWEYTKLLIEKVKKYNTHVWLVNTGWTGGGFNVGHRLSLKYTRSIIDAIHSDELIKAPSSVESFFGLSIPQICSNVPSSILIPKNTWNNSEEYEKQAKNLIVLFKENFNIYKDVVDSEIISGGPLL